MKKSILLIVMLLLFSCKKQQHYLPITNNSRDGNITISKNRAKNLNEMERAQIQNWINHQDQNFYSMKMNYWVNVKNLDFRQKKSDSEKISYEYTIYDFEHVKLYEQPKIVKNVSFGKFNDLKPIIDALHYTKPGETITLLIPSLLAFGTYGDNKRISNDMPLIIELKTLQN